MNEYLPYTVPNFWTERNSAAKRRQLEKRGMPDLKGGVFVTLTVDHTDLDEEEAYEAGKDQIRRFLSTLRRTYSIRRWFWKMEFHQPDEAGRQFVHWHMWMDYGGYIPGERLTKAWKLGRTDIRKVRSREWKYLFKYMVKQAGDLPAWMAARKQVRLFQTSMGFFSGDGNATAPDTPSPRQIDNDERQNNGSQTMDTIGERVLRWTRCAVVRSTHNGIVRHRLVVMQTKRWGDLLAHFARIRMQPGIEPDEIEITERKVTSWLPINLTSLMAAS